MVTTTTQYSFQKPTVGDDEDVWGGYLNNNFDSLDSLLRGATALSAINVTGNITVGGTVDGRDIATDGTKLDGIEASADVTDTANVTAAGALMDSELTSEASVKAINQGLSTSDSPDFQSVVINSVSTNTSSFATGTQGFVTDGYIRLKGIVNHGENGSGPAAIMFGDNNTYGTDEISLVTNGNNAVFINSSQDVDIPNGTFSTSTAIGEKYTALSGTTPTADPDSGGAFSLTLSGNTTFTFGAPSLGSGYSTGFIIELTGNATTAYTVTWPASVEWKGGTAPDAPAVGETDILFFWTRDGGTTWYGVRSIDAAA